MTINKSKCAIIMIKMGISIKKQLNNFPNSREISKNNKFYRCYPVTKSKSYKFLGIFLIKK